MLNWCVCLCVWSENQHVKRNVEKFQNWFFSLFRTTKSIYYYYYWMANENNARYQFKWKQLYKKLHIPASILAAAATYAYRYLSKIDYRNIGRRETKSPSCKPSFCWLPEFLAGWPFRMVKNWFFSWYVRCVVVLSMFFCLWCGVCICDCDCDRWSFVWAHHTNKTELHIPSTQISTLVTLVLANLFYTHDTPANTQTHRKRETNRENDHSIWIYRRAINKPFRCFSYTYLFGDHRAVRRLLWQSEFA